MISYWHPIEINDDGDAVIRRLVMWHAVENDRNGWPMVKKAGIALPGFGLAKDGKTPVKVVKRLATCIQKQKSPRVTVKKRVEPSERDFRG